MHPVKMEVDAILILRGGILEIVGEAADVGKLLAICTLSGIRLHAEFARTDEQNPKLRRAFRPQPNKFGCYQFITPPRRLVAYDRSGSE